MTISKLLIANRGEIACRIARTCKTRGIECVAVFTSVDRDAMHTRLADESYLLSPNDAPKGYLDIDAICKIAKECGADAIHPGYGFLSENAAFAAAVTKAGLIFIGPSAKSIEASGDKIVAKQVAEKCKVPCIPGLLLEEAEIKTQIATAKQFAKSNGYPIMAKAAAGGGGRGMRRVFSEKELKESLEAAAREAKSLFGDGRIFLEKLVTNARHVEVQIVADRKGNVRHLWDRDCSLQRKHQKVIEEAPAVAIPDSVRSDMHAAAVRLLENIGYESAATVEFLLDAEHNWYFLEINSRLQVEHPVTELLLDIDVVGLQIDIANGKNLSDLLPSNLTPSGHAIEARICAESPFNNFQPAQGVFQVLHAPAADSVGIIRFDSGFSTGDRIGLHYDSMLGKLIVHAPTRPAAIALLTNALRNFSCFGVQTNTSFLVALLRDQEFQSMNHNVHSAEHVLENIDHNETTRLLMGLFAFGNEDALSREWSMGHIRPVSVALFGNIHLGQVRREHDGKVFVNYGGQESEFTINASSGKYTTTTGCFPYRTLFPTSHSAWISCHYGNFFIETAYEPLREDSGSQSASPLVKAHLPGKVLKLHVAMGTIVEAEQALVSIESMKMEHILRAPVAGKVVGLPVSEGSVVESSEVLVELDYSG